MQDLIDILEHIMKDSRIMKKSNSVVLKLDAIFLQSFHVLTIVRFSLLAHQFCFVGQDIGILIVCNNPCSRQEPP